MTAQQPIVSLEPEKIDDITRRINLKVADSTLTEHKNKKLLKLQKTTRVDGFRKGKAPLSVIERMYGQSAFSEAIEGLCWKAWQEAIEQGDLRPLGQPEFSFPEMATPDSLEAQQGIHFSASYQVMPEIILGDYSVIHVQKEEASVSDTDIDTTISNILKNATHWHKVERPSIKDDAIVANVAYALIEDADNAANSEQKHDNERLVLSDDFAIPELLTHLIDVRAGDQVNCEITLPATYHNPAWQEKKAKFSIDVLSIEHPHQPDLDAAFAQKMGIAESEAEPVAAFRTQINNNLSFELQSTIRKKFRAKLLQEVVNATTIPVPKAMQDYCNAMIRRQLASRYMNEVQLQQYGNTPENLLPAESFQEQAQQEAATSILIEEIERQRNITVSDAEVRLVAEEIAVQYDDPQKFVDTLLQEKQSLEQCQRRALEDKIVRWLESQVHVTIVKSSYNEVLEPEQPKANDKADSQPSSASEGAKS